MPAALPPARVSALEALFRQIAATRMDGVPVLNERLAVQAVGFEAVGEAACGVLVTPWFMNLVWLPAPDEAPLAQGASRRRAVGAEHFDFIGAHEEGFGTYEVCSLFSPMFEFEDQAAALATAAEVLAILRAPPTPPPAPPAPPEQVALPARRALLLGRSAGAAP